MILRLDNLEMLLILEEENNGERGLISNNTLQLLYPPPNPTQNPIANPPPII